MRVDGDADAAEEAAAPPQSPDPSCMHEMTVNRKLSFGRLTLTLTKAVIVLFDIFPCVGNTGYFGYVPKIIGNPLLFKLTCRLWFGYSLIVNTFSDIDKAVGTPKRTPQYSYAIFGP